MPSGMLCGRPPRLRLQGSTADQEPSMFDMRRLALWLVPLFVGGVVHAATPAAIPQGDALVRTVNELDKKVFDAYNSCDLKTFGDFFSADIEFYHDNGGLMLGREPV